MHGFIDKLLSNALLIHSSSAPHLRTQLYTSSALPLRFHDARRSSDSSFRVAYDSQAIQTIYNKAFATTFASVITLIGALSIMIPMNWRLTLVSMAVLPPVVWAIRYYSDRIRRGSTAIQERESDLLATAQEGLGSIQIVQAFGRKSFEVEQFSRHATRSLEANFRLNMISLKSALVVGTLMALGSAVMYGAGSLLVLQGGLSLGDLLVFVAYLATLYQPIEQLTYTAWTLEGAAASVQRCFEVLDRQEETKDTPGAAAITSAKGEITFAGVSFAYDGKAPVLRGSISRSPLARRWSSLAVAAQARARSLVWCRAFMTRRLALCAWTAMISKRLPKPHFGHRLAWCCRTRSCSRPVSARTSGMVARVRPMPRSSRRRSARRRMILSWPSRRGSRRLVGERGARLSVGQRQRIGIARAFLKNAPVLLLDEPTSALDPTTEKVIMNTIAELMRGRTTLIITHRIATAHHLGRVVLLEDWTYCRAGHRSRAAGCRWVVCTALSSGPTRT